MNDEELRVVIRAAVARRLGSVVSAPPPDPAVAFRAHASHQWLPLLSGADHDGTCVIEPAVRCTHCGYCLSYGH